MAVPLTGSGGLFPRIGKLGAILNVSNTLRGTTVPAIVDLLFAQFASTDRALVGGLYADLASSQSAMSGYLAKIRSLASDIVIQMVLDDAPQTSKSLATAMAYVIAQMIATSATVRKCGVAASVASTSGNHGDPVWVVSTKTRTGLFAENLFADSMRIEVTGDAQTFSATAGSEPYAVRGGLAITDPLSHLWPTGSACSASLQAVDATLDAQGGAGNALVNGDFEVFTVANTPDSWTVVAGVAGTTMFRVSITPYDGLYALAFYGDGTVANSIYQQFGLDTSVQIKPRTQYAICGWARRSATDTTSLEFALVDGAGATILDDHGVACSVTQTIAGMTSSYAPVTGTFRTPRVLPSVVRLVVRMTAALASSVTITIDRLAMTEMTPLYAQGPYLSAFSKVGSDPIIGDSWTLTATNDRLGQFQVLFEKLFGMRSLGLLLPSDTSGSETIPDSLIA